MWTVLLAFCLVWASPIDAQQEDVRPPIVPPATGMKSGHITTTHKASVEINGTSYNFHPNIVLADDEGRPLEWSKYKKGDEVQFHLKREQIDYLILVLPK
jgi:hypothetical protein